MELALVRGTSIRCFFAIGDAFFNGADHVTGFTHTDSDLTAFVTDDDDRPEAEFFTAFDDFGNPANLNDPLLPVCFFFPSAGVFFTTFCHSFFSGMIVAIRSVLVRLPIRSVWIALVGRDYAVR